MEISADFFSLIYELEKSIPVPSPVKPDNVKTVVNSMKEFHGSASQISKGVHHASQKLSKLTKLVQHRGLFNDPKEEIDSLIHSIKEDLTSLNSQLESAQLHVENNKKRLGSRNQAALHSTNVVDTLKLQTAKAAQTFKKILQQRSDTMRAQQSKRRVWQFKDAFSRLRATSSVQARAD